MHDKSHDTFLQVSAYFSFKYHPGVRYRNDKYTFKPYAWMTEQTALFIWVQLINWTYLLYVSTVFFCCNYAKTLAHQFDDLKSNKKYKFNWVKFEFSPRLKNFISSIVVSSEKRKDLSKINDCGIRKKIISILKCRLYQDYQLASMLIVVVTSYNRKDRRCCVHVCYRWRKQIRPNFNSCDLCFRGKYNNTILAVDTWLLL